MSYTQINLKHNILVLNSDYNPINVCSAKRAIVLLLKEKAHLISNKVIRLVEYVRIPFYKMSNTKPSRNMVHKRDGYRCSYCGCEKNLTIDHIIPSSRGGSNDWSNLTSCCGPCNTKKANRTPEEAGMRLLRPAREPMNKVYLTLNVANVPEWNEFCYA
jgi:5-methylcytosine-specific restriction endonuclease McrA